MSRGYYTPSSTDFQFTANGDSSSGGGSGSGMECLQLRSPPANFHYLLSEQAKSLVALQELQNEVGALLEFRDLVIETFPNLRSKLASGVSVGGVGVGGSVVAQVGSAVRRDWEPGVRVRRKIPPRETDSSSLPRNRSDSHSKLPGKSEGAHSVVQDSGFSTETSSSKEAHSSAAPPTRQPTAYEDELWQLLDVIQDRGCRLREEVEALRGSLGDRRSASLNALRDDIDPAEEFRRTLAVGSPQEVAALRRERDLLLDRLAEAEAEALAGRVEVERLRAESCLESPTTLRLTGDSDLERDDHRSLDYPSRPAAPGPMRHSPMFRNSVFAPVTPVEVSPKTPVRPRRSGSGGVSSCEVGVVPERDLGKLDRVMNTPVRNLKVKTPDSRKIAAILQESDHIQLQRHLLASTVHNQILMGKLEKIGLSKGTLSDRLNRTREENDDLKFQLEEKIIELEGTRAHVRLLESGGRRSGESLGGGAAPRSMRALQPLPLHLQSDEDAEPEGDADPITDTPRKRPSKIPLPPSKQTPVGGLLPKPPTGRSKDTPSYRSRSGDSLGRPGSAQSWRKSDANSLSGSKTGNSISSTKSPGGGRNSSFIAVKTSNGRDSLSRTPKASKDSLTGKVRNNDSLSRIRDLSCSALSKGSKKDISGASTGGKKSSVPVRRASSGRLVESDSKLLDRRALINPWTRYNRADEVHTLDEESFSADPQILEDFITRSNFLARDKRLQCLSSDLFHSRYRSSEEYSVAKEAIDLDYQSPNTLKIHLADSIPHRRHFHKNDLTTMDVSTLHNSPTKSDVLFYNQPFRHSYESVWSRKLPKYYDSITNSNLLNLNYSSNLQSVTNDSAKREGLAECDSLDRNISFDDIP